MLMLPISIAMIAYALFTFLNRSEFIRKKQVGGWWQQERGSRVPCGRGAASACACSRLSVLLVATPSLQVGYFDDRTGPVVLCVIVMLSLFIMLVAAVKDMASR